MNKLQILRMFQCFQQAPAPMQAELAELGQHKQMQAGDFFFRKGGTCSHFALIGTGNIRIFKTGETGREINLYHLQGGQACLFNMLSTLTGMELPATAIIESPVEAVFFPAANFRYWMESDNEVRDLVFASMTERLIQVTQLVEEITFQRLDKRLADVLLQRFENQGLPLRVIMTTHEDMAAELGSAREVISRLLKKFQRVGAIELGRGRIIIKNEAPLRELAG